MKKRTAFTLVEILVVTAIVAVLAGITYPILLATRKSAGQTVAISNLHQCGVALALYLNEYETNEIPSYEVAKNVLARVPTCDPQDTWRTNCGSPSDPPLIGSFAY